MKKYIGYIIAIAIGLIFGAIIWSGNNSSDDMTVNADDHQHEEGTIWTCSMHPQIRQSEPGLCPLCGMDLTPAGTSDSDDDPYSFQMTENAMRLAAIRTEKVGRGGSSESSLVMSARIMADERNLIRQSSHIPGRIEQLYVQFEGQQIAKGAKIARIYSPELIKAQEELKISSRLNDQVYQSSLKKLEQWKLTAAQVQQILDSKETIQTFDLYAERSGTVTTRIVNEGNYVQAGEVLYEANNLSQLWLMADAYERDLASLKVGTEISFTVAALPGQTFKAKIDFIDPFIDPQTRTAKVRATISNAQNLLKPEMLAQVSIGTSTNSSQLTVPKSAVLWTGKRSIVYKLDSSEEIQKFRLTEVSLGASLGDSYEILDGLEAGDEIVVNGTFSVDAAAQLAGKASMMNQAHQYVDSETTIEIEKAKLDLPDLKAVTSEPLKEDIYQLDIAYIALKDHLVAANAKEAKSAAQNVLNKWNEIKIDAESAEVKAAWEKVEEQLLEPLQRLANEDKIDVQRDYFIGISDIMIQLNQSFGIAGGILYIQNCPMANDDKGADWLSMEQNIRNPYFGDMMLTCGTVEGKIETNKP
ncbi:efflux RND transporter periplasmic adaptor subunit [Fulvivirgaceae bacterium LMO-SS25]